MKKNQTKHFVPDSDSIWGSVPACNGFQQPGWPNLPAFPDEIAKTRRDVTCKNCKRTKLFKGVK